jgi:hypothetical protein
MNPEDHDGSVRKPTSEPRAEDVAPTTESRSGAKLQRFALTDRTELWLLFGILLLALALRLYHYDYDVGHEFTYDTEDKINQARRVASGVLEPRNWKQPYFLPYAGGALIWFAGLFAEVDFELAERLLTLLMIALSVATIAVTQRIAREVLSSRWLGLLAAALLAAVPLSVIGARYIKEDMPVLFFSHVALLFMVLSLKRDLLRYSLLAGLAVGWAIGSKFSAVLLVPIFIGARLLHGYGRADLKRALLSRQTVLGLLFIPVGLACFNPYALLEPGKFVGGFLFQASYSAGAHHDGTRVSPWTHYWTFYLRRAIVPGVSLPVALAFLFGLFRLLPIKREPEKLGILLLGAWTVLAYFVFEKATAKPFPFFARYLSPIVPSICVLAAWGVREVGQVLSELLEPRLARRLAIALALALVLLPLTQSALISAALAADTRLAAASFIEENLPRGSKIALDDPRYSPRPNKRRFRLKYFGLVSNRLYDRSIERLREDGYRYVVLNNFRTDRFRITRKDSEEAAQAAEYYRQLREQLSLVKEFRPRFAFQTYGFHNPVIAIYELR